MRSGVLALIVASACTRAITPGPPKGHVVVAVTIDWEGADLSIEALDALEDLREDLGDAPMTHFMSAAYFTKQDADPNTLAPIRGALRPGDQLAVHLHLWRSLATAAGVTPKLSPSFLTGTDELVEFENDAGFETDPDAYTVVELRAFLRKSRTLLERTQVPVTRTFRAGGYLATPKMMDAIGSEGFTIDSSASDHRQLDEVTHPFWLRRMAELWPDVDTTTQPYIAKTRGGPLLEMPIAATSDYATTAEIVATVAGAHVRLQKAPEHDVFVVLALHLETAPDYAARIGEAVKSVRSNSKLADDLLFTTLDGAAEMARSALGARPNPGAALEKASTD